MDESLSNAIIAAAIPTFFFATVAGYLFNRRDAKIKRTIALADEYSSEPMLHHRARIWLSQDKLLESSKNFEVLSNEFRDRGLSKHDLFFSLIMVMFFYRKIHILDSVNQIDRNLCCSICGKTFQMHWNSFFKPMYENNQQGDDHEHVLRQLATLSLWLKNHA